MQNINDILSNKVFLKEKKRYNLPYEKAKRISDLVGCSPIIVMRLKKKYGVTNLDDIYSWLKDYPNLNSKKGVGLLVWKFKQMVSSSL